MHPLNIPYSAFLSIGLFISKFVNPLHPSNALPLIFCTLEGITTLVSPVHPENADSPILVTLSGIVIDVMLLQFSNALYPILVALPGITTFVSDPIYFVIVFPSHLKSDSSVAP